MGNTIILGKELRKHRKLQNKTYNDICSEVGLKKSMIGHIERGERRINKNKIDLFVKAYNIDKQFIVENNVLESKQQRYREDKIKICKQAVKTYDDIILQLKNLEIKLEKKKNEIETEILLLNK